MVITPTNQHDSPPLHPTLERPSHLDLSLGAELPETITVHPDASHDSRATRTLLEEIGCRRVISPRGTPLETGKRRPIERTHSRDNHGFKKLAHYTECPASSSWQGFFGFECWGVRGGQSRMHLFGPVP